MGRLTRKFALGINTFAAFLIPKSLRRLLIVSVCLITVVPINLQWFTSLDYFSIYAGAKLNGINRSSAKIGIVSIPDAQVQSWLNDDYSTDQLSALIANILHASKARIGLVFNEPLPVSLNILDLHISTSQSMDIETLSYIQKKRYLIELLNDSRVSLGTFEQAYTRINPSVFTGGLSFDSISPIALSKWFTGCIYCTSSDGAVEDWSVVQFNALREGSVWRFDDEKIRASFEALLIGKGDQGIPPEFSSWASIYSRAEDINLPVNRFVSAYGLLSNYPSRTIDLSFQDALQVSAFPDYVLVGTQSNYEQMRNIADSIYGVQLDQVFEAPLWVDIAQRIILLLLTLYFCFCQVRIRAVKTKLVVFASIASALILVSVLLAYVYKIWFSSSFILLWAFIVAVLMHYWQFIISREKEIKNYFSDAIADAALALEVEGNIPEAISLLAHHPDSEKSITRICTLSEQLSEKTDSPGLALSVLGATLCVTGDNPIITHQLKVLKEKSAVNKALLNTAPSREIRDENMPETLGRYQIKSELGRGAVGIVYRAFDPAIARDVAVKTLDTRQFSDKQINSLKERFFREAEAAGRLNHPNIVSVYDVGQEQDLAFIAMDFVRGQALSEYISNDDLLPVSTVYQIVIEVAGALSYAHEHQIVHRDIKPGNIMFAAAPFTVKVADFGIARLLDNSQTRTGEILGSPLYMSPEQLRGSRVSAAADLFSLGVTFYQLLSGALPFDADNLASLTYEIIHTKHRSVRTVRKDLPASSVRIINQCLQKKPEDRYESAAELAFVLKKAFKRDFPSEAKRLGY